MMTTPDHKTFFAPQLFIKSGVTDIDFYIAGLGAVEIKRWTNDDNTLHVAELSINGAIFHLHEERPHKGELEPIKNKGVTALVGLFVDDVDKVMADAVKAGAIVISPAQDYDYDYRQGEIKDPFGHIWLIQKKII
ncbi:MAG TPA: VOC family protein [Chitinophagaceae bacterium]|nr:VOC family protein [Chitinophagaceae bacterium]